MKLLRSWPECVPATNTRSHVVDTVPRLYLADYDYRPLVDVDDDVVMLEWDIAVDRTALAEFVRRAKAQPDRVIVGPYRLYETTVHNRPLKKPVWCHRRSDGSHVDTGEQWCSYFGFGLAYFPRDIVKAFAESWPGHFSDGTFSGWHRREVTEHVEIIWDAPAAHLHYKIEDLGFDTEERAATTKVWNPSTTSAEDDELAAATQPPLVAGLLRERAAYKRTGRVERIVAVDEQLIQAGYGV